MRRSLSAVVLVALTGCASILGGGSSQPVQIQSSTPQLAFTVTSSTGIQMGSGAAPSTVTLPRKNEYQVALTAPGFQPQTVALTKGTNGWFWANLVIGGIPGFIIDFITGAAYKLEPAVVNVSLVQKTAVNGSLSTDARVAFFDAHGRLIRDTLVPMVPVASR